MIFVDQPQKNFYPMTVYIAFVIYFIGQYTFSTRKLSEHTKENLHNNPS